jgi:hypothetical protein
VHGLTNHPFDYRIGMFLNRGIVGEERNAGSRQAICARSNLSARDNQAHLFRYKTRL